MSFWAELLVCVSLFIGCFFTLVGAIGLYRLPDFFCRLHGPAKATTMGVGGVLIASMLYFSLNTGPISVHELLITLFLMISAPVTAHMLSKAAIQQKLKLWDKTQHTPWEPAGRE